MFRIERTDARSDAERAPLYVAFTMDCHPATARGAPEGPKSWEQSAAAIDGYCTRLARARFPATLFLTPRVAEFHAPLLEEAASAGAELGLLIQPQSLDGMDFNRFLGHYGAAEQRSIIARSLEGFQDALARRPQSARSAMFSATDDTYSSLFELGFRQGSVSNPGRHVAAHRADWRGAEPDPHYVDARDRLRVGDLPFFEVPVTTDATSRRNVVPDLTIENGTLKDFHQPFIETQLQRMERSAVAFRALCFTTRNVFPYHAPTNPLVQTLDGILNYLDSLNQRYEVVPVTLTQMHGHYHASGGNRLDGG